MGPVPEEPLAAGLPRSAGRVSRGLDRVAESGLPGGRWCGGSEAGAGSSGWPARCPSLPTLLAFQSAAGLVPSCRRSPVLRPGEGTGTANSCLPTCQLNFPPAWVLQESTIQGLAPRAVGPSVRRPTLAPGPKPPWLHPPPPPHLDALPRDWIEEKQGKWVWGHPCPSGPVGDTSPSGALAKRVYIGLKQVSSNRQSRTGPRGTQNCRKPRGTGPQSWRPAPDAWRGADHQCPCGDCLVLGVPQAGPAGSPRAWVPALGTARGQQGAIRLPLRCPSLCPRPRWQKQAGSRCRERERELQG